MNFIMIRTNNQTICVEELVKQRPVLTKEEMKNFYSYEEAIQDCLCMFDEEVQKIKKEFDNDGEKI